MAVFRNVMVYLGLGPDEEYDDGYFLDEGDERRGEDTVRRLPANRGAEGGRDAYGRETFGRDHDEPTAVGAVRPLRPVGADVAPAGRHDAGSLRYEYDRFDPRSDLADHSATESRFDNHVRREPVVDLVAEGRRYRESSGSQFNDTPVVRAIPIRRTKPVTLAPESFGDAKLIADEFKRSTPVIMNLQGLDRELARRLIDFASGVCYSLSGSMEKIASQVFLLTPKSVEVSDEDRRRIEERGFAR
ncbi:MAG: cell division protein SepF [Actinomycetota bacterium]|nr:cell division protein SepF [Actinomycetota bacterium]